MGMHLVAHIDVHDVTRHEVGGWHIGHHCAIADALARAVLKLLERLEGVLSIVLLPDADNSIQDEDEQDDERLDECLCEQDDAQ